jgi:hypothetical protein
MADVQPADIDRYIKPHIRKMYAEMRSAVKEHMVLVKSQYQTGLSRVSRDGGFGTVGALDISSINPVTDPTPVKSSVKGASSFSSSKGPLSANFAASTSVAEFAKSGLRDTPDTEQPEPEPQPEPGADQDGDADQADPTLQGIWTKSIAESATEVAKSNQLLLNNVLVV